MKIVRLLALFWLPLAGCSSTSSPGIGGETNWLKRCSDDAACGQNTCVCGICTRECSADRTCDGALTGSCVATDSDAVKPLCAAQQTAVPARVCLPRCDADADCGADFDCLQAVCVLHVEPDGGTRQRDAGPDSALPDASAPQLAELAQSRGAWDALVAAMGDTYSYAEENCLVNAMEHTVTTIQVENGTARLVTTTLIASSECLAQVNRYADFQPRTLPELYDECKDLVTREGNAVTIELDERSVIRACTWPGPGPTDCTDNCGEGFYLRSLLFGTLTVP